ncbi:MAG: LEA type 2 family protein, partial [Proteobacteria bacterium]|nr:LEA type 2 family protein [Pseudomonadota bacterium]
MGFPKGRALLGVLLASLILGACTYFRQMIGWVAEKPEIHLVQVDVQSFSVHKVELVFVLDIINPNAFRIDIEGLEYRVQGLDMELGKGEQGQAISLESKEHSTIRLPFVIDPEVGLKMMKKYLKNPKNLKLKLLASMHL